MVGFKFSSLIVFLSLLLVGCMPQNKQTDCKTNEAFSASLRTCVPIIPSEDSFIHIGSFTPSYNISAYKNNTNNIYLAVGISNPYNQAYTLNWRRNFNGLDLAFNDDDANNLNRNFMPASFSPQVGAHIITVQVLNSQNQVVDSHSWTITLTEAPTPYFTNQVPTSPSLGDQIVSGTTLTFQISGFNNGGAITPSTQITWSLDNATPVPGTECSVTNSCYSQSGSATSVTSFTTPALNTMSIGVHTVTAVLKDSTRIYAQFTWAFNIVNPPKAKVTAVFTRDNDSNSNNQTILARTGVPYSNTYDDGLGSSFRNFFLTNAAQTSIYYDAGRTNFCLKFERDYGAQAGSYMDVKFFLDGNASPVATVSTTAGDDKVCLSDATAAELLNVVFNNANPNATENHYIHARIYDQFIAGTGKVYQTSDFQPGSGGTVLSDAQGAYVSWTVVVKPQNESPTASFGATQLSSVAASTPLACTSNTSTEKAGCEVYTDTNFRVSLLALKDDFYMLPFLAYADANFNYTLRLYRNTTLIHTCSKTLSGMDGSTDSTGPEFACSFNIPSFGASGPINTSLDTYHIEGEISDVGSPYSAYGAVAKSSSTFKWYLDVKETNNAPSITSIAPASGATINEGSTVNFQVTVEDLDRDNHTQNFYLCTKSAAADPSCSANIPLTGMTQSSARSSNALAVTTTSSLTLAEDFLHQLTDVTLNCKNLLRGQTCAGVRFLVEVVDQPFTATPVPTSQIQTYDIVNINPAPQFNEAQFSPDESLATHEAVAGVPFILNPGTITDATNPLIFLERQTRYQWYSSIDNTSWAAIPGATSSLLIWTPAAEIAASGNNIYLKLCTQDQPSYVIPTVDEEVCSNDPTFGGTSIWTIKAHRNYVALDGAVTLQPTKNMMAVWKGPEQTNTSGQNVTPVYTVYVSGSDIANSMITIEKSVLLSTGGFVPSGFATLSINPKASGDLSLITDIQDLSITGTNESLYIAYRLATSATPTQYRFYIRRIDIGGPKSNTVFKENKSFGFSYADPTLDTGAALSEVTIGYSVDSEGTWQSVQITDGSLFTGATTVITLAGVPFTAGTLCPSGCSDDVYASSLVSAVNSSSDAALAGIYAEIDASDASGRTLLIKGAVFGNSYHDTVTNVGRMGQIYVSGNAWHVPFINRSLVGVNTDKPSVYTQAVDVKLNSVAITRVTPATASATGLAAVPASSFITNSQVINEAGTDYIILGSIDATGSKSKIYKIEASGYALNASSVNLFGGAATYDLKVAATNSVNKYFVLGDAYDSSINQNNFFLAKFGQGMAQEVSKTVSDPTFVNYATQTLFTYSEVRDVNLVAYAGGIARVFVLKDNTSLDPKIFSATLKTDNTLTCHGCAPISGGIEVNPVAKIALSPVRFKNSCVSQALCVLGTEGYDSTPGVSTDDSNYRDVLFMGYSILEAPGDYQGAVGVFNLQSESIHSTSLDSVAGKYRPPFFTP